MGGTNIEFIAAVLAVFPYALLGAIAPALTGAIEAVLIDELLATRFAYLFGLFCAVGIIALTRTELISMTRLDIELPTAIFTYSGIILSAVFSETLAGAKACIYTLGIEDLATLEAGSLVSPWAWAFSFTIAFTRAIRGGFRGTWRSSTFKRLIAGWTNIGVLFQRKNPSCLRSACNIDSGGEGRLQEAGFSTRLYRPCLSLGGLYQITGA